VAGLDNNVILQRTLSALMEVVTMPRYLGIDIGGGGTKTALLDQPGGLVVECANSGAGGRAPDLAHHQCKEWPSLIASAVGEGGAGSPVEACVLGLPVTIAGQRAIDPAHKISNVDGVNMHELGASLTSRLGFRCIIAHDAQCHLAGHLAAHHCEGTVGYFSLGSSIGFAAAIDGHPLEGPYTPFVSHISLPLPAGLAAVSACRYGHTSCWTAIYGAVKGNEGDARADSAPLMAEVTAEGLATSLCVLPLEQIVLGGGVAARYLDPLSACGVITPAARHELVGLIGARITQRVPILPGPPSIVFAAGGDFAGAIGAAHMARRLAAQGA
jgi:predicted NBD/HSP70 family sugar kinase